MGVDYSGNYGIGCEVQLINKDEDFDTSEILELIDDILEDNENYSYFEVGSEMYGGGNNSVYLIINDPFRDSYDITEKVENLREFCEKNGLLIVSEIDVVGGLLID